MQIQQTIERKLEEGLEPEFLEVVNESHMHSVPPNSETHFRVTVVAPVFDGKRVSIYMEVEGLGDFLPKYAGNLDIMTAAGLRTAEMYAEEILAGNFTPVAA